MRFIEIIGCIGFAVYVGIGIYINLNYPDLSPESGDMMEFC